MNNSAKASADMSVKSRALTALAAYAALFLFCLAMAVYDISTARYGLGAAFALVAAAFAALSLLKLNSAFGTYIKVKDGSLYMRSWSNDFLPYETGGGLLADLKPAKTKLTEISAEELSVVLVGTKDFIKRNVSDAGKRFIRALYPYEHSKSNRARISAMDIFYVETIGGECSFMCVHGYDPKSVMDVVEKLYEMNPELYVKVGSRAYKKYVMKLRDRLGENR